VISHPPLWLRLAGANALAVALVTGTGSAQTAPAATPPPPPPPISASPATPAASPGGIPAGVATPFPIPPGAEPPDVPQAKGSATPSPPPNERKGLDGVWEIEIQHPNVTDYTHVKLTQNGNIVTGEYMDAAGKKFPLAGSVQGDSIRMIVTKPDGTTIVLEGRLDGTTDMVGMLTTANGQTPFTAEYRPKEKWIENVNPAPGGIGMPNGGYTPP
jgi:hypothetical protein